MKKVYIAGPYSGPNKHENVHRAREAAAILFVRGWAPFVPHTMTLDFEKDYPYIRKEVYLKTDLEWLEQCDAVFMLPGWEESAGARGEYHRARESGLPCYSAMEDVPYVDEESTSDSVVDHPLHYTQGTMECIEAIEGLGLAFHEAQILKYIVRWRYKSGVEDLKKAKWFLERLIERA